MIRPTIPLDWVTSKGVRVLAEVGGGPAVLPGLNPEPVGSQDGHDPERADGQSKRRQDRIDLVLTSPVAGRRGGCRPSWRL
jgi:hypothetical protein